MPATLPNPLHELHRQADAEFQPYADLEIVSTFGEPQAEYAAVRKSCAMLDFPQRGVLELSGKDRHSFLSNLLTNKTWDKDTKTGLAAGQGVYAFLLNTKGRIVADMNVLGLGERTLLEMDARMAPAVASMFEKYLFTEKVTITDRVGSLHEIALHGPGAAAVLTEASGSVLADLPLLGSTSLRLFDTDVAVWRDDPAGVPGYHLLLDPGRARTVWMSLLSRFGDGSPLDPTAPAGKRRLRPAGWAAFNATRIEAGRPLFDIDFGNSADPDQSMLPAETGQLDRAVSFTKGCYLGQEIVARMYSRGQVARQIAGIRLEDDSLPIAGSPVYDEQSNAVGAVTSSTVSPVLSNAAIALAFLKKPFFTPGSTVHVPAEGAIRKATVVKLPFV